VSVVTVEKGREGQAVEGAGDAAVVIKVRMRNKFSPALLFSYMRTSTASLGMISRRDLPDCSQILWKGKRIGCYARVEGRQIPVRGKRPCSRELEFREILSTVLIESMGRREASFYFQDPRTGMSARARADGLAGW